MSKKKAPGKVRPHQVLFDILKINYLIYALSTYGLVDAFSIPP